MHAVPGGLRRMKRRISITIPEEIYQLIHEYAAERGCTHREIIIEALTEYLDQTYHFPDLKEEE